jgi:hypothetical protein
MYQIGTVQFGSRNHTIMNIKYYGRCNGKFVILLNSNQHSIQIVMINQQFKNISMLKPSLHLRIFVCLHFSIIENVPHFDYKSIGNFHVFF